MDERAPFSDEERFELRVAAVTVFDGLRETSDSRPYLQKWIYYIRIFLRCIDREKGTYLRFPWDGGAMRQPVKSMEMFDFLQSIFMERVNAHYEAIKTNVNNKMTRR